MQTEIVIAGFGGQGVLFAGELIAYAALDAGKEVTWIPSYGPEMRGGTANCTVIISDEEIGSPLVLNPRGVIALNLPSFDKYELMLIPGGALVANASLIDRDAQRTDISVILIPASELAEELGDKRLTNMVALGALLEQLPVLSLSDLELALKNHLPDRHRKLLTHNIRALRCGAEFVRKELANEVV